MRGARTRKRRTTTTTVRKMGCTVSKRLACNESSSNIEDDVMFEIFLRLPSLEAVFEYRLVSKQWLSILSNPIFISSWMTINDFTPSTTLVIHQSNLSIDEYFTTEPLDDYSQFMSDHDGVSLEFLKLKALPEKLYIVSSSHGLVLCATTKSCHTKYYVCNPLMKTSVLLPRPPTYRIVVAGLICEASVSYSTTSSYKVVRIPHFSKPKTNFSLEIFSSDLGKWNTFEVSCPQEVSMPNCLQGRSNIIEHNGVLYWIEGRENRIVAFDNNNRNTEGSAANQCKLILLPEELEEGEKLLAELDVFIVCFHGERGQLSGWVLEDGIKNEWMCRYSIPVTPEIQYRPCNVLMRPLAFDHVTQNIVIMFTICSSICPPPTTIYTYDIRTGRYLLVGKISRNNLDFLKAFVFTPSLTPL